MVKQADAFAGQSVDVGRLNLSAIAANVGKALAISQIGTVPACKANEALARSSARIKRRLGRLGVPLMVKASRQTDMIQ